MSDPTYHELYITTADIPRASIFDLPYGYEVTCTRVGGWQLLKDSGSTLIAGEYSAHGLRLDLGGHVICDSL
jgi:hypothetical protein